MKLYIFPGAPNPTKVLVYLGEKQLLANEKIDLELVRVDLRAGEQHQPDHLARNPLGKLPVLELDDGSFFTESLPILEYLEELQPEPVMIGATPEERARVRSIERMVDIGVLMAGSRAVHASNSPLGLPKNPPVAKAALEALETGLVQVDQRLERAPFVAGDRVSIADCTLFSALFFQGLFGIDADAGHPNVLRWKQEFAKRPSVKLPA